jgi:hypothetical protein
LHQIHEWYQAFSTECGRLRGRARRASVAQVLSLLANRAHSCNAAVGVTFTDSTAQRAPATLLVTACRERTAIASIPPGARGCKRSPCTTVEQEPHSRANANPFQDLISRRVADSLWPSRWLPSRIRTSSRPSPSTPPFSKRVSGIGCAEPTHTSRPPTGSGTTTPHLSAVSPRNHSIGLGPSARRQPGQSRQGRKQRGTHPLRLAPIASARRAPDTDA